MKFLIKVLLIFTAVSSSISFPVPADEKKMKPYPSMDDIKLLEVKLAKATLAQDLPRAIVLETALERAVIQSAWATVVSHQDRWIKTERLRQLTQVVKRDRRTIDELEELLNREFYGPTITPYVEAYPTYFPEIPTNTQIVPTATISDKDNEENHTITVGNKTKDATTTSTSTSTTTSTTAPKIEKVVTVLPEKQKQGKSQELNELENEIPDDMDLKLSPTLATMQDAEESKTSKQEEPTGSKEKENETEDDSSEEEATGVAGIISGLLGMLSTPEGAIDTSAIVGLIGGLSVQRDDGSYDFQGLQDLIGSFFAPPDDGTGGSDVGGFLGGLLGATIRGIAGTDGAKGAGKFLGNLVNNILPGLSAPPPPPEGSPQGSTPKPLGDSGGFLAGLLQSVLGGSSGGGGHQGGSGNSNPFLQLKFNIFKTVFSAISGLLTASSG